MPKNTPNPAPKSTPLLDAALYWLSLGVDLLPCYPNSKAIVKGYGPYKWHIYHRADAIHYFGVLQYNLAVICDKGLVCIDFDSLHDWRRWHQAHGHQIPTRVERTPRGMHLYFFSDVAGGTRGAGFEVKANGAAAMAAPSRVNGRPYYITQNNPVARVEKPADLPFLLSPTPTSQPTRPVVSPAPPQTALLHTTGAVDAAKYRLSILAIAEALGISLRSSDNGRGRWYVGLCPFHKDRKPSLWIDAARGRWGCRSPNCPQRGTHDQINLEALRLGVTEAEVIKRVSGGGS